MNGETFEPTVGEDFVMGPHGRQDRCIFTVKVDHAHVLRCRLAAGHEEEWADSEWSAEEHCVTFRSSEEEHFHAVQWK